MSDNKKQSTLVTASEINKEVEGVKEGINTLEDKASKLAQLLGSSVEFAPWEKKEAVSTQDHTSDLEAKLAAQQAERKAAEEQAKKEETERKAAEEAKKAELEAARKAEEERLAAEQARKAEEERLAAEQAKKAEEEPTVQEEVIEEPVVVEEPKVEEPAKEVKKDEPKKQQSRKQFNKKPQPKQNQNKVSFTGYFEKVVGVKKISKTTKGGRHMRFSALVIIGDKNGIVGYGKGKSIEVPVAIRKALKNAKNNLRKVKINKNGTLYHEVIGKQGAGKVLIKPAPEGTGIIAGGPIRVVLELAGYKDVYSKNLGKNTSINMVLATLNGLSQIRSPKEIAYLRDKQLKDL